MKEKIVKKEFLLPFSIITLLFVLWGFANDITNPLVAAFRTEMEILTPKHRSCNSPFMAVMALVGGALLPPLQGAIIDLGSIGSMPAVNVSFVLPLTCFVVISIYGYRAYKVFK